MIINALNSGAKCFMADLEDSLSPTWEAVLEGQQALYEAVRGTIRYTIPEGKEYKLLDTPATLIVRPRGWHMVEKHFQVDGAPVSASLFDFGLYFFNNAHALRARGSGPYFYLPKLESAAEAKLWADVFAYSEAALGLPHGTIKCTVLIETLPAAFAAEAILYELRDYIVALNCGRWDYIFSTIKTRQHEDGFMLPDRSQVTMTTHAMRSYSLHVIQTCHKHGAMALGGMSAFIPVKDDAAANDKAMAQVKTDKEREATDGHDGTWVAHPALVPVAMEVFNRLMPTPNQLHRLREDITTTTADLLAIPTGTVTEAGVRNNLQVALRYIAAWLGGQGCVPIFNLMEDAATAEISRSQLWLWLNRPQAKLDDGRTISHAWVEKLLVEETDHLLASLPVGYQPDRVKRASALLRQLIFAPHLTDFLTIPAYEELCTAA